MRTLLARHVTRDLSAVAAVSADATAAAGVAEPNVAELKSLVEVVARALADEPDVVAVTESERRGGLHFELLVASG